MGMVLTETLTPAAVAPVQLTITPEAIDAAGHDPVEALRQKPPFRFVDEVFEGRQGSDGIAGWVEMEATDDRLYDPELFSSFLIEALAQLAGILGRRVTGSTAGGLLAGIETARFSAEPPARTGILLYARLVHSAFPHFTFDCTARQSGETLCACTINTRTNTGADQ